MDKLKMQTPDTTENNIEQIAQLFPEVITETKDDKGNLKKAIDFDLLRQLLSKEIVEDDDERYRLDWPGKKTALLKANTSITKTLRPSREESVKFDITENLYIEGDNFEVLKILQESYLGKVKMIYIDPPYNTGNDFIYKDKFAIRQDEYEEEIGTENELGEKLFRNTDSNGRFHSDWLSMMYERLVVTRDLLKDDGVIFISIDEKEISNLHKLCEEVYGEENYLTTLVNVTGASQNGEGVKFQKNYESIVVYAKNQDKMLPNKIDKANEALRSLNDAPSPLITRPDMGYTIYFNPTTEDIIAEKDYDKNKIEINIEDKVYTDNSKLIDKGYIPIRPGIKNNQLHRWRWGYETFNERKKEVIIKKTNNAYKAYFTQSGYNPPKNIVNFTVGTTELKEIFDNKKVFDFPKYTKLLKHLIRIGSDENDIIMDFFSGTATLAHAVIETNKEYKSNRKFIVVQMPENCDERSEAYKLGYKTIADIGKERLRRVGKIIIDEINNNDELKLNDANEKNTDIGFRVYKTATTNMKDVFYHPNELKQDLLSEVASNIKDNRSPEDLLTQVILDLGLELNLPIEKKEILGNIIFIVQTNALVACFDDNIDFKIVDEIAELEPLKVVFKDASFKDDKDRINVEERFKRLSPDTRVTVI